MTIEVFEPFVSLGAAAYTVPSNYATFVQDTGKVWQPVYYHITTDPGGSVGIIDSDAGTLDGMTTGESSTVESDGYDIAYDSYNDMVYALVGNGASNRWLCKYSSDGAEVFRSAYLPATTAAIYVSPVDGKVFVPKFWSSSPFYLYEVDATDGTIASTVKTWSSGDGPMGRIAVDANGNIWGSGFNGTSGIVYKITPGGTYSVEWTSGTAYDFPYGIVYIDSSDYVLVDLPVTGKWLLLDCSDSSVVTHDTAPVTSYWGTGLNSDSCAFVWNPQRGCVSAFVNATGLFGKDVSLDTWSVVRTSEEITNVDYLGYGVPFVDTTSGDVYWTGYRSYGEEPWETHVVIKWSVVAAEPGGDSFVQMYVHS